jgi:glutathione S-transferase
LREIVLRAKPAEMLAISPKGTVPVLQLLDGQVIEQSVEIMRWALQQHDPLGWLPADPNAQARMLALIADNDGAFKASLDRYKYPNRYPEQDALFYRGQGEWFLAQLEARLTQQTYLCSAQISLADVAIFPFVRQFAQVDRAWFDQTNYPHVHAWLAEWLDSPLFTQAMQKFELWQSGTLGTVFASNWGKD